MRDTSDIRKKMLEIWEKIEKGKISHGDARVHIGIARTILDTLKVEIAAAHLDTASVPAVSITSRSPLTITNGRKAA